jgi:pilus assembly protein Flp/PilA
MIRRITQSVVRKGWTRRGSVFVEYILLVSIVGIGVIVGLAVVREALVNELVELAEAINAITP